MRLLVSCFSPNIQYRFWRSSEQQMHKSIKRVNALAKGGKRGTNHVRRPHERWVVTMNVCMPPPRMCLISTPSPPCSAPVLCEFFSTLPITCKITSTARGLFRPLVFLCLSISGTLPFLPRSSKTLNSCIALRSHSFHTHTHTHRHAHTHAGTIAMGMAPGGENKAAAVNRTCGEKWGRGGVREGSPMVAHTGGLGMGILGRLAKICCSFWVNRTTCKKKKKSGDAAHF